MSEDDGTFTFDLLSGGLMWTRLTRRRVSSLRLFGDASHWGVGRHSLG